MRFLLMSVFSLVLAFTFSVSAMQMKTAISQPTKKSVARKAIRDLEINVATAKISVMAYNIENLFDTEHDEGKDDWTNLPLEYKKANAEQMKKECAKMSTPFYQQECLNMDWSEAVLAKKMERVADSILQINGRGPDVLIVEEVENLRVLQQLNSQYLKAAGYQTVVLLEGEDERGIDVGILSRFPLAQPAQLHLIEFTPEAGNVNWERPTTRGIMEAPLKLPNGETLFVLGFHFPSQSNPLQHRLDAVATLNKVMQAKGPNALVLAAGDSNITALEDKTTGLVSKTISNLWSVSHLVGCKDCKGTHFYKGEWNFLDLMLFSSRLSAATSEVVMAPEALRVPTQGKYQLLKNGTPARFDAASPVGVSDHLPLYGELTVKSK